MLDFVNTEVQLINPLSSNLDAAFGQVALVLLERGDARAQQKLLALHEQARGIIKELEALAKKKK